MTPMNESIRLHFVDYDDRLAERMLWVARDFAVDKIDGRPGVRYGTVYRFVGGGRVLAYWTRARAVVVRELTDEDSPPAPSAAVSR